MPRFIAVAQVLLSQPMDFSAEPRTFDFNSVKQAPQHFSTYNHQYSFNTTAVCFNSGHAGS